MIPTPKYNENIAKMIFASVYPRYVCKVESMGRPKEKLDEVRKFVHQISSIFG
jgi:hypothetical protein